MIPRSFDLVRWYWFHNHFLKHSHLQIFVKSARAILRRVRVFLAAVHNKFSLFVVVVLYCFCFFDQRASGQTMYGSQKCHCPWLKCHENKDKSDNDCFAKWPQNKNYSTNFYDLGIILFKRQCFNCWNKHDKDMLFSKIKVTKLERSAFWDTQYITISSYENYSGQNPQKIGSTLHQIVSKTTELPCTALNPIKPKLFWGLPGQGGGGAHNPPSTISVFFGRLLWNACTDVKQVMI